jgi:hypothetical protein
MRVGFHVWETETTRTSRIVGCGDGKLSYESPPARGRGMGGRGPQIPWPMTETSRTDPHGLGLCNTRCVSRRKVSHFGPVLCFSRVLVGPGPWPHHMSS